MRKIILATAAVLSLGTGAAFAAQNGANGYMPNNNASSATVESGAADRSSDNTIYGSQNPWQGTESWNRWNQDHAGNMGGD